jgi:hypothetical protein
MKSAWFKLESRKERWTLKNVGKPGVVTSPERCYDAEHVLEWQLLAAFIEEDKNQKDQSRCALLMKYFEKDLPKTTYKIKAAKDNGKLDQNNRFNYADTDYAFDKWNVGSIKTPRAIDYISTYIFTMNSEAWVSAGDRLLSTDHTLI